MSEATNEAQAEGTVSQVGEPPASYRSACEELDAILEDLEEGRADIDALTGQVARARYLLAFCTERLQGARLEVRDVLDEAGDD